MRDNYFEDIVYCKIENIWQSLKEPSDILIVSGDGPEQDIAVKIFKSLKNNLNCKIYSMAIPSGEEAKTLNCVELLWKMFSKFSISKSSLILGVGGGSISDSLGFASSTYYRGLKFSFVPTTLLSMVDAAIGAKRAINFTSGKNIIGSFYPADSIFIDSNCLNSLNERELKNGYCEIIKMGLISGGSLFENLQNYDNADSSLDEIIKLCIEKKQEIVSLDPYDNQGIRTQLNYGHTLAHAMEAIDNFAGISHGLAVALGMDFAAFICGSDKVASIQNSLFKKFDIYDAVLRTKNKLDSSSIDCIVKFIRSDKKSFENLINFVLLNDVGSFEIQKISLENIKKFLLQYNKQSLER